MKKYIQTAFITAFLVVSVIVVPSASAQTTRTFDQTTRCDVIQARLDIRISRIEAANVSQAERYVQQLTRIQTIVTSAGQAGYDTTALDTAQEEVKTAITTFEEKATAYGVALMSTKNLSCGDSDGAFATSLVSTRLALAEARTASLEVRVVIREQAIPAIRDYAQWLKDQATPLEETE